MDILKLGTERLSVDGAKFKANVSKLKNIVYKIVDDTDKEADKEAKKEANQANDCINKLVLQLTYRLWYKHSTRDKLMPADFAIVVMVYLIIVSSTKKFFRAYLCKDLIY